jgi:predicted transcriptional regulator
MKAMPKIMTRLSNQLFKDRFDAATSDERDVLYVLSEIGDIASPKDIEEKNPELAKKNVSKLLTRLADKDCVKKFDRGEYSIFLPLFAEYVKARMTETVERETKTRTSNA